MNSIVSDVVTFKYYPNNQNDITLNHHFISQIISNSPYSLRSVNYHVQPRTHTIVVIMEFVSVLTKISLYNTTVSIVGSVIGLRHDISDYNAERKGNEPQHENVRVTMK